MAKTLNMYGESVTLTGKGKGNVTANQNNIDTLNALLKDTYGFNNLGKYFIDRFNKGDSVARIVYDLRNGNDLTPEGKAAYNSYLTTFPSMNEFLAEGGAFSGVDRPEQAYLSYRNSVRDALKAYGIDQTKFGTPEKIVTYIKANANPAVILNRIQMADAAVRSLPQEVKAVFSDYYNIQDNDLTSYYLDTTAQTESELKVKEAAARIGQEAIAQGFKPAGNTVGITASTAENYARYGVTPDEARKAFSDIVQSQALTTGGADVETVTQSDLEQASIYNNAAAIQKVNRIAGSRQAEFQKGGSFIESQRGVAGLGSSSV